MKGFKYTYILFALLLSIGFTSSIWAQTRSDLQDPKVYSLVLWTGFLQKEGMTTQVESTLSQALTLLREADKTHGQNNFTPCAVLISKTPEDHITPDGHFAISFTAFLEEGSLTQGSLTQNSALVLASRIAYLFALGQRPLGQRPLQRKDPESARHWVREYLSIPPEPPSFKAQTNYDEKLRGAEHFRLEDFINTQDLKNYTLRLRILKDPEGLIVPVEKDSRLLTFLEGNPQKNPEDYPIQEIPLSRLLNSIELQITGSLIKDIKFHEIDNEYTTMVGKGLLSLLIYNLIDSWLGQRLKFIKLGWLQKTTRVLTFFGGFFVIDAAIDETAQASGYNINAKNIEKQDKYEKTLLFLTERLEQAKLGVLNIEQFKKEFCMKLGLDLDNTQDLHLFDEEAEWAASIEGKLTDYYVKKTQALKNYLEKVQYWLERISHAKRSIDPDTGLISYELDPRTLSELEKNSNWALKGGMLLMAGEYAYTKFYKMKRILYSGRIFGGIVLSALTINYLLGASAQEPLILPEDQKMNLETELLALQKRLPQLIHTYELLSQKI